MSNLIRGSWLVLLTVFLPPLIPTVSGQTDLSIYIDRPVNGFEDWTWAKRSVTNTSPVHSGKYSMSVTAAEWEGVYFWHRPINTSPYANLSFWAHGGHAGGQLLRVQVKLGTNDMPGYSLSPLPAQQWEEYVIPLQWLGAENKTNLQGILIQLRNDSPTETFYIDDVRLAAARTAPSAPAQTTPVVPPPPNRSEFALLPWIGGALGLILALLIWLVFVTRRSAGTARSPSTAASALAAVIGPNGEGGNATSEEWRQRALTAEAVASKQAQLLRSKVGPELAQLAKNTVVQGLVSQRNSMLDTQRLAEQELAALEARLSDLQLPLRDRILVYEQRISELEKELATRSEEMHELVRVTLSLVRQRLEEEKKKEIVAQKPWGDPG